MATAKSKIEQELIDATSLKRKVAEKPQAWMTRLIKAAQDLAEDDWEKLTEPTQLWVNAGTKAIKAEKDIPVFPSDDGEEEEAGEDEPEEKPARRSSRRAAKEEEDEDEEEKPARRSSRRAAKEEEDEEDEKPARKSRRAARDDDDEDEKPAKKSAKKAPASDRKVGAQTAIKKLLCKNPKLSTEDLLERLEKQGYSPTPLAVSSIRSGFRNTVKILNEAGLTDLDLG